MRDLADSDVTRLVERVYACSVEPGLWEAFLEELSSVLDCRIASFFVQDLARNAAQVDHMIGADSEMVRLYEEYYCQRNIFLWRAGGELRSGFVATDAYIDPQELLSSEYYNDYFARFGIRHSLGACVLRERQSMSMLTLLRSRRQGAFDRAELRLCQWLLPHLRRAVAVHRRLSETEGQRDLAWASLDRLPHGVVLVDRKGRVGFANRAARRMARQCDGLVLRRGEVRASHRSDDRKLRAAIANACSGPIDGGGEAVVLRRPSLRSALAAVVIPLERDGYPGPLPVGEAGSAALFVTDREASIDVEPQAFCDLYGLTAAEAEVARRLLTASSPARIAEELGVSIHTVRTHLKRIFAKTDTRGQSDLVRILAGGVLGMGSARL